MLEEVVGHGFYTLNCSFSSKNQPIWSQTLLLRRNPLQSAECCCGHLEVLHSPPQHQAVLYSRLPVLSRWQWSFCIPRSTVHASTRTAASAIAGKLALGTRCRSLPVAVTLPKTDCGSAPCVSNAGRKQSISAACALEPSAPAIARLAYEPGATARSSHRCCCWMELVRSSVGGL